MDEKSHFQSKKESKKYLIVKNMTEIASSIESIYQGNKPKEGVLILIKQAMTKYIIPSNKLIKIKTILKKKKNVIRSFVSKTIL